ncbi:MAG: ribosome maturation factor RimM [SAR86 cluster bacterium]|uniref:Ribosome maturation factor RimM n=1 Tax=SAR86 cluster bacterium TaxID=2030880 RepID=A0A2A5AXR3_9GAMM|nr:MAG: ribosome maturation factor RimM [SAR86 cluster bacterium]
MSNSLGAHAVVLGQIGRVHGLKGWLKLISFTSPLDSILDYSRLQVVIENKLQVLEIDEHRQLSKALLVHFKGFDDPELARKLTGLELSVERKDLPPLDTGEYYWHQLQGLKVINQHGELFGLVSKILETGANDVLVISANQESIDDRERLIPYLMESVIDGIDLETETIKVNWEADYLD